MSARANAAMLTVLWLVYPIILAVAPDGLNYIGDTASVLLIAIVDVVSKVVYGLLTVASDAKTTERDLAESGRPAAKLRAAA